MCRTNIHISLFVQHIHNKRDKNKDKKNLKTLSEAQIMDKKKEQKHQQQHNRC